MRVQPPLEIHPSDSLALCPCTMTISPELWPHVIVAGSVVENGWLKIWEQAGSGQPITFGFSRSVRMTRCG